MRCEGEGGTAWTWLPLKTSSSCSLTAEDLLAWSKRVDHRQSTNWWGQLVVGHARVHLAFCSLSSVSLHQAASPPKASWGSNGRSKQEMSRTFIDPALGWELTWGLVANPGSPGNSRVPLYFPSIFLYCNIHKMSVSIMSCRRNFSQVVFTGYLFKQGNYLPICLADFQPLSHHTGMLFKLL